ncbi:class B sortase [Peptoniphilus catoniae]|uniref:class B sortase n=1 Tax=Peptoniphilus catoniae TaxID=1660341 RepID=UPI0010FD7B4D|nr:class B sortase [Peptoniphilus catoniae]
MKGKIISIIRLILIVVLAISLYKIYNYYQAGKEYEKSIAEVQEQLYTQEEQSSGYTINEDEIARGRIADLKSAYPFVVAWIKIPHTSIDYPVVKTKDNDFFLTHNYKGEYNPFGAIYMDFRNNELFTDQNTILYGHNVIRGGNFRDLHLYEKEGFFEKSPYIEILTTEGYKKYQIFAAYIAGPLDKFRSPSYSPEEAEDLKAYIKERNILSADLPEDFKDVITLQTCSPNNKRLVIQGVKIED